jgi:large subunit ribosomal protein L34
MSFTYNPHKRKRARAHGFLGRQATPGGRSMIRRRRQKGRAQVAI